ncbi:Cof-type HAD-IIB family hydrolase [Kushneria konosiri]|uniref:Haloacid dehalogenase n=1 Tax=Kushneria konosiri TaxID=698828 RepID=A0A2Z2H856_9GAMM|nr:Cof-type HAD-IIB family hydrolase [Kushneria konosiri]ARS53653.1 haloacid dehalogenase [Kushneria konosiri]
MTPHLIVTDLDRTLLNADHGLDDITIDTFQTLERQGHSLAIASGRHYQDIREVRRQLGVNAHIISANGAHLHGPDDQLIHEILVPQDIVRALLKMEVSEEVRINLYTSDRWLIDAPEPKLLAFHESTGFTYNVVNMSDVDGHQVGKVLFIGDPVLLKGIETHIRAHFEERTHVTYSLENSLEVMEREASKGQMLHRLAAQLDIPISHTVAFGDNLNDTDMLQNAGRAFAMGNAHPQLLTRAPNAELIKSHTEAGVAVKLRELFAL